MKLQILKLTIFYTLFSFSTLSATCQGEIDPTLSTKIKGDIQILQKVTSSVKKAYTDSDIVACLENIDKVEFMERDIRIAQSMVNFHKGEFEDYNREADLSIERALSRKQDCELFGKDCNSMRIHERKFREALREGAIASLEAKAYKKEIEEIKEKIVDFKKTFNTNCENEDYDKDQVLKLCKKEYSNEFPVCRVYMRK